MPSPPPPTRAAGDDEGGDDDSDDSEEEEDWAAGRKQLEALKLKSGQSSSSGLRRHYKERYEAASTEVESFAGLRHFAVYKSYTISVS